jgi:hypothetical protein
VFVVSSSLSDAYALDAECADAKSAFEMVARLNLGAYPAVVADLSRRTAIWCPGGIEAEILAVPISLAAPGPIGGDGPSVATLLEEFHQMWKAAPDPYAEVWDDEAAFVPAPDVEQRIVGYLLPVLRHRLRDTHLVRREEGIIPGRSDLSISGRPDRGGRGTSVVGVTVVRTMAPPDRFGEEPSPVTREENGREITLGLEHASYYRGALGCTDVTWCIFDMQREDDGGSLADDYRPVAEAREVDLRRLLVPNRRRSPSSDGLQN